VAVLDTNGNLKTNFNSVGYQKLKFNNKETLIRGIGFLNNGKLVCCGAYILNGNYTGLVAVCSTNGALDYSFSSDGFYDDANKVSILYSLLVDCKDNIYVGGYKIKSYGDIYIKKIKSNGLADSTFANNSEFSTRFNAIYDEAVETMNFSGKTKIIFAGRIASNAGNSSSGIGRLLIPDCSNTNNLSKINLNENSIAIYPNPVLKGENITIDLSHYKDLKNSLIELEVYNIEGKKLSQSKYANVENLLFSTNLNLTYGVYLVKINIGSQYYCKKLIVE
jgi:hypothetical protein